MGVRCALPGDRVSCSLGGWLFEALARAWAEDVTNEAVSPLEAIWEEWSYEAAAASSGWGD